jgi:hypothetical protein
VGDGTKENPYTREDVLRLIEENGGTTKGIKICGKNLEGADLSGMDLSGIIFEDSNLFRAKFDGSDLQLAMFSRANLYYTTFNNIGTEATKLVGAHIRGAQLYQTEFRNANLISSHWEDMNLDSVDLRNAYLFRADFTNCYFYSTKLEGTHIRGANIWGSDLATAYWGNYVIGEENDKDFDSAETIYRRLKQWYTNAGVYDIAGEFFFMEMTAQRKRIKWWPHPTQRKRLNWWLHPRHRLWSKFVSLICGYGERPLRVILWAVLWVFGLALVCFLIGSTWQWGALLHFLYFSAVSFTALGYGSWLEITNDWIRGIGAFESFVGVFTIALFLITFTRKMRR